MLTNVMAFTHLSYEALSSHIPHIRKEKISKTSWSQAQLKAALAGVTSGRKIRQIVRQFDIHDDDLTQRLKLI
jgi:hypothetical protein